MDDVAPRLADMLLDECRRAAADRPVSPYFDLRPMPLPIRHAGVLAFLCRGLVRDALARASSSKGPARVGVHLWGVGLPGSRVGHLLVAATGFEARRATAENQVAAWARPAAEALGGELTREPASGVVWRVTLPLSLITGPSRAAALPATHTGTSLCP